jgi:hypothetical protein
VLLVVTVLGIVTPAAAAGTQKTHAPTVGSTIRTGDVAVTLRSYRRQVTTRDPVANSSAEPLSAVTAINVEICNKGTGALPVRRNQFFLELQDGRLFFPAATLDTPRPQLQTTRLARRQCLRRWVSYLLPTATRAAFAVFQAGAMFTPTLHKWTLPNT